MEIFKQLKKLGYNHYIDLTIEELDSLPFDNIEKRIECSLVIDWLDSKHNLLVVIIHDNRYGYKWRIVNHKNKMIYNCAVTYQDTPSAKEQAILKAIELIKR